MACQEGVCRHSQQKIKNGSVYLSLTASWLAGRRESHGQTLNFWLTTSLPIRWRILPSFLLTVSPKYPKLPLLSHISLFSDSFAPVLFFTNISKHPRISSLPQPQPQPPTHSTPTPTTNYIKMSAIAKPVTILAGLLLAGTATTYTVRSKNSDFSAASLAASDMDAAASAAGVSKPKL
jgi:hypothetical protein